MNDYNKDTSDYEPNFILTPSESDEAADAKAGQVEDTKAGQAEDTKSSQKEAATGIEDALAAKAEQAEAMAETAEAAEPVAKAEATKAEAAEPADQPYQPNFILKDAEPKKDAEPEKVQASASEKAQASEKAPTPNRFQDPYSRETTEMSSFPHDAAKAAGAAAAAGAAGATGAARSAGKAGSPYEGRPKYENPSFDPGKTGNYTDPRDKFRPSEAFRNGESFRNGDSYQAGQSASWSNGEFHSSRKAVKDSIRKQKKQQKKTPQPIMMTRKAMALLIAGCMFLSCLFGLGGAALGVTMMHNHDQITSAQTTTAAASASDSTAENAGYSLESATGSNMTVKEITAAAKNSVVEIRTESVASDTWMQQYVTEGAGSGVIISEDGYIMTNNHVIEGANKIKVTTADEKEYEAELIGTDDTNDVAVIKIKASGLTPATFGNSDELEVGDLAVAIGNPLGELGGTVTAGIISATDRELAIDGKTLHLLQTDSSINPGNSGGGLFNGSGQLIGLVVAKSSGSDVEGLGFAIPINTAADVAQQLKDKGYVSGQPSTGMTYTEGSFSDGGDMFNSFDSFFGGGSKGVFIYSVNGENARNAGFEAGDQVFAVDGEEITSFDDLSAIVTAHKVGDKLTFTIIRNGRQKNIKLELEEKQAVTNTPQSGNDQNGQDQGQDEQAPDNGADQGQNGQAPDNGAGQDQNDQQNGQQNGQPDIDSWGSFFDSFF